MFQSESVIRDPLDRGTNTPCTWADRDAYITEKTKQLLSVVIEPVAVAVTSRMYDYEGKALTEFDGAVGVARQEDSWLLYIPSTKKFALAWGTDATSLEAHGFSSEDALAEWLG